MKYSVLSVAFSDSPTFSIAWNCNSLNVLLDHLWDLKDNEFLRSFFIISNCFLLLWFPAQFQYSELECEFHNKFKKGSLCCWTVSNWKRLQSSDQNIDRNSVPLSRFSLYVKEGVMNCRFCCVNWPTVVIVHVRNTNKNREFFLQIVGPKERFFDK